MARQNIRPGFGAQRGAINPPISVSEVPPINPKYKDLWMGTSDSSMNYWNGSAWIPLTGGGTVLGGFELGSSDAHINGFQADISEAAKTAALTGNYAFFLKFNGANWDLTSFSEIGDNALLSYTIV
jgi:hypothetical protein